MSIPNPRDFLIKYWKPLSVYGGLFATLGLLLWWKLSTLTGGYSNDEVNTQYASRSVKAILDSPFNAPFHLLDRGIQMLTQHSLLAGRITSAILGMGVLIIFCTLLARWHGRRTAIFGTFLFGTSAWFLHTARLGTPDILLFSLVALVACGYWVRQSSRPWALLVTFALAGILLYIPGMIWLVLLGAIWQWKKLDQAFKKHLGVVSVGAVLFVAIITPLAWAFYRDYTQVKGWIGLPDHGWPQAMEVLRDAALVPIHLFVRGPGDSAVWLARLPVLDIFAMAMLFLGSYIYFRGFKLARTKIFASLFVAGCLLVGLGVFTLSIILPFLYLIAAVGVKYLLDTWLTVFPRNPIARGIGAGLLSLVVLLSCTYNVRQYFVAWPQAHATKAVFTVKDK